MLRGISIRVVSLHADIGLCRILGIKPHMVLNDRVLVVVLSALGILEIYSE